MTKYIIEPDPTEAAHDGRCSLCGSCDIDFQKDLGTFPVETMWEGKRCQRVKKSLWLCNDCGRAFTSNTFITQ